MPEQATFIPKTSVARLPYKKARAGWLVSFSLAIFVLSLLAVFGLFFYRGYLGGQAKSLAESLKKVESDFEPSLILELQRTSKAITSTRELLAQHVAPSRFFKFLEESTISDVHFINFSYDKSGVKMSGVARSYTALAQQATIFEKSRLIKNASFSNFSLTSEGFVNFALSFAVEPELIFYKASAN